MNFQSIKGMIESLTNSYKCPECGNGISDVNIDIIGAAGTTINIDVECFNCGKHSIIKTEILAVNLTDQGISNENIEKIKNLLLKNSGNKSLKISTIKDEEIIGLNKDLKKGKLNVSDLLG